MNYKSFKGWEKWVGEESTKSWIDKLNSGFWDKYCSGKGLDIGYAGYLDNRHAILPSAIGVGLDYPGYDGFRLPFEDTSQSYVFNSHVLEHIENYRQAIQEWFRVTKPRGHIVIVVPHRDLYERKSHPPSLWNEGHFRFYTPASLLKEIEDSLEPNSYRIRYLEDNDKDHTYGVPVEIHANGCYELTLVLEKLDKLQK